MAIKTQFLASTDENKEVFTNYTSLWDEIKYLIKTFNGVEAGDYKKDFKKIKFSSDDNLPLKL